VTGKLGILAGGGELPMRLVEACRAVGREVFVLAFEGQAEPDSLRGVEHVWSRLGAVGGAIEALRRAGVTDLVMAGPVRRPSLRELRPDMRGLQFLARVGADSLGDDGLLTAIVEALEDEGFRVLGVDDVLTGILAEEGPIGRHRPDEQAERDIARGVSVARALGAVDVGQAAVVQEGLVLGVEAIEGTDRLLVRCQDLRRAGPGGVLVKVKKPNQESRADLPTIGAGTVKKAAAAGLRGIAVQAGGALILDRARTIEAADKNGLFVVGVRVPE
jgi:DUF1009 family protein